MARLVQKLINSDNTVTEIYQVTVHKFLLTDVEDPELYAAQSIYNWEQTDEGKFVKEHAVEIPVFQQLHKPDIFGYEYVILAKLEKNKLSEFYLRFGKF